MAQTTQYRTGGNSSSESSTPLSPEQQFEEDTKKAIALSLEASRSEEHRRTVKSPQGSTLSTPTDGTRAKTPTNAPGMITLSGQGSSSNNLNNFDPFSIDEQQLQQATTSEVADLMLFSFDHVLKNYDRQKTSQPPRTQAQPHRSQAQPMSQFTPAFPLHTGTQNRAMPLAHSATLPAGIQPPNTNFGRHRPGLTHQQSFPVPQTSSSKPIFSPLNAPGVSGGMAPMASSWNSKPTSKYLHDLSINTLPQQSRSSPPSPTPGFMDIDAFLTPEPTVTKAASSQNPFAKVPHGQPLSRSTADELMQMLQDVSPSDPEYMHPPTLPPRKAGQGSQGQGSQVASAIKIAPPAQTIRRISSHPSITSLGQTTTTQQNTSTTTKAGCYHIASSSNNPAPPLPPKMYANRAVTEMPPVHPPKSNSSDDLIMWSPKQKASFMFDDDFSMFDPLKLAAEKEAAKDEAPALPPKGASPEGKDATDENGISRERPASYSNTKEVKKEKPLRPKTVHGNQPRPKSLEMGKTDKWTSGSRGSMKTKPEKAFFGDGLFDLAAERDEEAVAFAITVKRLRDTYASDNTLTNPGYVRSPIFSQRTITDMETSVKVVLMPPTGDHPTSFTCDVNTLVQHIISQGLCYATDGAIDISSGEYVLKVPGLAEYLDNDVPLSHYEYVQECRKFDRDVKLVMLLEDEVDCHLARTEEDDAADINVSSFANLFDKPLTTSVSRMGLTVLLDTFTAEGIKLRSAFESGGPPPPIDPLIQVVKAICHTLASVESNSIASAIQELQASVCPATTIEKLTDSVLQLVDTYCQAFDTDFGTLPQRPNSASLQDITTKGQNLRVCVQSAHRLPSAWKTSHEYFVVTSQVCYGGVPLGYAIETRLAKVSNLFFDKISWSSEVEIPVPVSKLPRESRLCLTLYGVDPSSGEARAKERTALGWVAIPLFTFRSELQSGSHLLGLWPGGRANPIGTCASNLLDPDSVILQVDFNQFKDRVIFPPIEPSEPDRNLTMSSLDPEIHDRLKAILERDSLSPLSNEDATLLWNKRHYCYDMPAALSRILVVAPSFDWACLSDIYGLLQRWTPMESVQALELLHPRFADREVRSKAVEWIRRLSDDELCDYLPQLVQALKYETYHDSALASFLIERALCSIRIAHYLFWYLKDSLRELQFSQRVQMVLGALLSVCGQGLRDQFTKQEALELTLSQIADQLKRTKDSSRISNLQSELSNIPRELTESVRMATNAGLEALDLNPKASSYFSSFTVPLRLVFTNADALAEEIVVMFKAGEDMRQDMLTMQMIRIMDKLWLSEGLDLRMITFRCMATGPSRGFVELVKDSETLRKIQVEHGVTGSFKDKTLAEWLQKHNSTELDYQKAVENFTYSCAGYCVATYVLGIGDRHNDNIMVTKTGHMFHVDFFKFLGNAQMFGSVKRDRVPFVLTSDMAYVINGGDKPSPRFQEFVDLCCEAFNLVRQHANLFFNLFGLMLNAGIHQLSRPEDLKYVQNALKPQASDEEATATITRLIEGSLGSKSTQINFFIHNLAHHSFTAANSLDLSFAPKRYSIGKDGKITAASIFGIQKRYENAKYYVYIVKVFREGSAIPSFIFRRYREFQELNIKLRIIFPQMQSQLPVLSSGPLVGRTHIKQVAEKRKKELDDYIQRLMHLPIEASQHDLVYTFFHPLLRDEKDAHLANSPKLKQGDEADGEREVTIAPGDVSGQVKLSINYKDDALFIMVRHAKDLICPDGSDPDPYVKTYLLPDHHKVTKRKTRMVKKTCNPTYNEMLVYKLPISEVKKRCIRLTVWNSDYLKENAFLGGIDIPCTGLDLTRETQAWYRLGNLG